MKIVSLLLLSLCTLFMGCGSFDTSHSSSAMVHTPEGIYTVSPDGGAIYYFKFNQSGELFYERSFSVAEEELEGLMEMARSCTFAVSDTLKQILKAEAFGFSSSEMIFIGTEAYTVSLDRKAVYCFRYDEEGRLAFYKSVKAE
ncbi:MAG: hypothetical protein ACE5JC_06355 [Candidatus Zixiibacteriota bacterium]